MTAITLTKYLREVLPISPLLCLDGFFEKTSTCKFQVNYMQSATSLIHPLSHGASQFNADSGLFKSANRENCLPLSHIKLSGAGPLDWQRVWKARLNGHESKLVAEKRRGEKIRENISSGPLKKNISCDRESVCCKFCIPSLYLQFFCFHPPRMNTPPVSKRIASQILPVQKFVQPMLFTQRRQFKWTRL